MSQLADGIGTIVVVREIVKQNCFTTLLTKLHHVMVYAGFISPSPTFLTPKILQE